MALARRGNTSAASIPIALDEAEPEAISGVPQAQRTGPITEDMKLAAAKAIAGCISQAELSPEYIVPSVFNRKVVDRVAAAVQKAAIKTRVARRGPKWI
jgi:malic enzyme